MDLQRANKSVERQGIFLLFGVQNAQAKESAGRLHAIRVYLFSNGQCLFKFPLCQIESSHLAQKVTDAKQQLADVRMVLVQYLTLDIKALFEAV